MTRIPKLLHYTFGFASDFGGKPWSLIHHVCLKSAVERIRPERVLFYYEFEPTGPWWALSRELVTPVRIEAPREVFGRPLCHVAHRSDVVRLQKLIEHGGVYLDADVLVQRDFDDLLDKSTVLGLEGKDGEFGMANAVILAEPNAPFLRRWLDAYRSFRSQGKDEYWSEHSVRLPARLAAAHPEEITILPPNAFFWPLWTQDDLRWIFRSNRPIPLDGVYANHLWEAEAWRFIEHLTPGQVRRRDTNFNRWARPLLDGVPDDYGAPPPVRRLERLALRAFGKARRTAGGVKQRVGRLSLEAVRLRPISEAGRRRRAFQKAYSRNLWGDDGASKFYSGVGSRGEAVETYAQRMASVLRSLRAELGRAPTVVDLGCGDFEVGRALLERAPDIRYIGCDIVPELIAYNSKTYVDPRVSFRQLDLVSDPLPDGDVCLVRQVLQHLSNADIAAFLKRLRYPHVYVTEGHPAERAGPANPDKAAGADVRFDWRTGRGRGVELDQPPYGLATREVFRAFAPPHEVIITERVIV
jgi:SAM-dependent methyltransferase